MQCIAPTRGTGENPVAPGKDAITALAHEFWLRRGRPIGSPELDWLQAESELRNRIAMLPRVTGRKEC